MLAHRLVEQLGRVGGVELIDVVVQRATVAPRQVRDSEAVIGKAGAPARLVEAGQAGHAVDLITAVRVAHLFQRIDKHALSAILGRFGTQEYAHGRCVRCPGSGCQDDRLDTRYRDVFPNVPWGSGGIGTDA